MKPTVGRIVHYHLHRYGGGLTTYAALITGLNDGVTGLNDGDVCLCVFKNAATPKGRAVTEYVRSADYSEVPKAGCWSWPPRE